MRMGSQENKEDRDEGIGRELDYYATFAQNADFRQFVRKLSRCRSIASLDVENIVKGTESNGDGDIIEDEKGKTSNNKVNFSNKTSSDDNIQLKDYKSGSRQNRTRKQAINTWSAEQEPTGRGENIQKTQRPYSDMYQDSSHELQKSTSNIDLSRRYSESPGSYSSLSLPRNKRASVILREKHQSMMMIQEDKELKSGVFTLPRVSCYHRSTR